MRTICLLTFLALGCYNASQIDLETYLSNDEIGYWILELEQDSSYTNWKTIWRFSKDGDFHEFFYNTVTKDLELKYHKDNIESNTYSFRSADTIVLNKTYFPIVSINENSFYLKNLYGLDYHPTDSIHLIRWSLEGNSMNDGVFKNEIKAVIERRK